MGRLQSWSARGAALLAAATALCGCMSTATYGTGEAPEKAIFREMTGGLAGGGDKPKVDYHPRAPLVMPPSAAQLPQPVATASAANAQWPIDPDQTAKAPKEVDDGREGVSPEEYRRLKPLAGLGGQGPVRRPENERDWMYGAPYRQAQGQKEFKAALDERANVTNTERRFLTDPPVAVRAPAQTAPTQFEDIDENKSGNFLTRWLTGT